MLKDKYKDITFYTHNLGRYDSTFIVKNLVLYNTKEGKENPYILEPVTRNSDIIKLVIKRKINGKIRRVKLQDSATFLTSNLRDLCDAYEVSNKKSYFPYDFCNSNTLFYKGITPRVLRVAPGQAVVFPVYEKVRQVIETMQGSDDLGDTYSE